MVNSNCPVSYTHLDVYKRQGINREEVQLISKCGIEMPCENRSFEIKSYNYSKEHILSSVDRSLENLKTDYLDLFLIHRPSPLMNPEEIAESFHILREQKKAVSYTHLDVYKRQIRHRRMLPASLVMAGAAMVMFLLVVRG